MLCIRVPCAAGGQDASVAWGFESKVDLRVTRDKSGISRSFIFQNFVALITTDFGHFLGRCWIQGLVLGDAGFVRALAL